MRIDDEGDSYWAKERDNMKNKIVRRGLILGSVVVGVWLVVGIFQVIETFEIYPEDGYRISLSMLLLAAMTFSAKMTLILGAFGPPAISRWVVSLMLVGGFCCFNDWQLERFIAFPATLDDRYWIGAEHFANLLGVGVVVYFVAAFCGWRIGPEGIVRLSFSIATIFVLTALVSVAMTIRFWTHQHLDGSASEMSFFYNLGNLTITTMALKAATAVFAVWSTRSWKMLIALPLVALISPVTNLILATTQYEPLSSFPAEIVGLFFIPDLLADAMIFFVFWRLRSAGWEMQIAKRRQDRSSDADHDPFDEPNK